jgi:poly(3-hydroxybutyrate) depolymerase
LSWPALHQISTWYQCPQAAKHKSDHQWKICEARTYLYSREVDGMGHASHTCHGSRKFNSCILTLQLQSFH